MKLKKIKIKKIKKWFLSKPRTGQHW